MIILSLSSSVTKISHAGYEGQRYIIKTRCNEPNDINNKEIHRSCNLFCKLTFQQILFSTIH